MAMGGGKAGNHKKLTGWMKTKFSTKKVSLFFEIESMKKRKQVRRGVASVNQNEMLLLCSAVPMRLPEIGFTHCPGSNKGSGVGPIKVQPYSECWCLRFEQKKQLYGRMRLPVGGAVEEDEEEPSEDDDEDGEAPPEVDFGEGEGGSARQPEQKRERGDLNIEPATFNSIPPTLCYDLIKCYGVENILDLAPLDGELCITSVELKKNYLGVCFNEFHCQMLEQRVREKIFERLADPNSDLYNADYMKTKAGLGSGAADAPTTTPKPTQQGQKKDKKYKKKKKKDKKGDKRSSSSSPVQTGSSS